MSKATDIQAFKKMITTVEQDANGTYFEDLVKHEETVAHNIGNDFPWYQDIYVSASRHARLKALHDDTKSENHRLHEEIDELRKHDIRKISKAYKQLTSEKAVLLGRLDELQNQQNGLSDLFSEYLPYSA